MRLFEITADLDDPDDIVSFIKENCQPYLNANPYFKSRPLYRGIKNGTFPVKILPIRKDRRPKDTGVKIHNLFVEAFKNAGIVANRDNSIFCSGGTSHKMYGNSYVVFPIGDFDFSWSPVVDDLYGDIPSLLRQKVLGLDLSTVLLKDIHWDEDPWDFYFENNFGDRVYKYNTLQELIDATAAEKNWGQKDFNNIFNNLFINSALNKNATLININLDGFIKENYKTDDWSAAIDQKNEILITGDYFLAIEFHSVRYRGVIDAFR